MSDDEAGMNENSRTSFPRSAWERKALVIRASSFIRRSTLLLLIGLMAACGCRREESPLPVSGKVDVDGVPLSLGHVTFYPDESEGNTQVITPNGPIRADGTYELVTGTGGRGAPAGKYKVVVAATKDPLPARPPPPKNGKPWQPNWLHHEKYASAQTTDLRIEVVKTPQPGQYDLHLSK